MIANSVLAFININGVIQKIAIKDFDYFKDYRLFFDENASELFVSKCMVNLQGEK